MKSFIIIITVVSCIALSCNSNTPATAKTGTDTTTASIAPDKTSMTEKNKTAALAFDQSINSHNATEVFKFAAADIVDYGDGSGPPVKGLDSCKAYFQVFLTAFPDVKGENLMAIAEGNQVAVFGDWSGTFKATFMGMKPTGKSFKVKDVDLFTFNDEGKITEHRSVQSNEIYMMQVGAKMKLKKK